VYVLSSTRFFIQIAEYYDAIFYPSHQQRKTDQQRYNCASVLVISAAQLQWAESLCEQPASSPTLQKVS
jgi:hypothetical protein